MHVRMIKNEKRRKIFGGLKKIFGAIKGNQLQKAAGLKRGDGVLR